MTQAVELVAVTSALRDWLQAQNLAGVVGARVYAGGLPSGATRPCVAVSRVGGFNDGPIDRALIQIDSYGTNGAQAETVDAAARTVLQSTRPGTVLVAGQLLYMGASELAAGLLLRDPASGEPRYVTTVEITTKAL